MKQDGIGRETNHKRLLISQNKLRVAGVWGGGRERVVWLWTLGRVCAMVSAVKCVNLVIHKPVPLGLIIHYMFILKKFSVVLKLCLKARKSESVNSMQCTSATSSSSPGAWNIFPFLCVFLNFFHEYFIVF